MVKFTNMDILQKITDFEKELSEALVKEQEYHDKAILLRRKIQRMKTSLRDFEEIINGQKEENADTEQA